LTYFPLSHIVMTSGSSPFMSGKAGGVKVFHVSPCLRKYVLNVRP
jgi:hypothetical protein